MGAENTSPKTFICKVIQGSKELPRSSKQWTKAKKCKLQFEEDGLCFLDIFTPYKDIEKATIHIYSSALFFQYGILSITSQNTTTHFGITYSEFWKKELPFSIERIEKETPFLLFRKSLIIMILIYIFWEVVKK